LFATLIVLLRNKANLFQQVDGLNSTIISNIRHVFNRCGVPLEAAVDDPIDLNVVVAFQWLFSLSSWWAGIKS
jgi:hypothetical protein